MILDEILSEQQKLDAIDTQLSAAIEAIEHALRERLKIRVDVATPTATFASLGFGKHNSKWCLTVESEGYRSPLLSAPRAMRAEALEGGHLRRIVTIAADVIRTTVESRSVATKEAAELLTLLGAQQGEPT